MPGMTKAGYVPPAQKKEPPKPKKPKKKKRLLKKRRRMSTAAAASLAVFAAALLIAAGTLHVFSQVERAADVFAVGQMLAGHPLGGLTAQEGAALLDKLTEEKVSSWRFDITCHGRSYALTTEDIGLFIDKEASLEPLWQVGKTGGMLERYADLLRARTQRTDAAPVFGYTMEPVDALLAQIKADTDCESVDATVSYRPGSSEPFRFTNEQIGYELDTTALRRAIEQAILALEPGSMTAKPKAIQPNITRAVLENAITLRARVTMILDEEEAALENVRIASGVLDGLRIEPQEELSFNETVGRRTAEGGYLAAPEPAYGIGVSGVGGGVCQVSTALYRAALLADVPIISRSAAIRPVDYCEMGQEAVVSDQGLDLRIKNSGDTPLFLTTRIYQTEDKRHALELQIIGKPIEARYALSSSLLETETIEEPVYMRDKDGTYATYTDERVAGSEAQPGYSVVVERLTIGENGETIAAQVISEDIYEPVAPIVYVGVTQRE